MAASKGLDPTYLLRLKSADADHHWHPFTCRAQLLEHGPFVIERAEGTRLYGEGGIVLLDAMAGLGCVNIGYGHKKMVKAAAHSVEQLSYYHTFNGLTHPMAAQLASKLAQLATGSLNRVFFSNSGSEANETIAKIVRAYWRAKGQPDRTIIISRDMGYHGSTLYTTSLNGLPHMHAAFGLPMDGCSHIMAPYAYRQAQDGESLDDFGRRAAQALAQRIEELGAENVAAFIAEPVQATSGAIIPPETYWPEIARICDDADILLIADEVVTGFGRTGRMFGQQSMGFQADIMTLAKGLSSAYAPIAASVVSDEVGDILDEQGTFQHGFTTSGHPLACTLALCNISIIEDDGLVDSVAQHAAPDLARALAPLASHPLVGEVRQLGLIAGIELVKDRASRTPFPIEMGVDGMVANNVLMQGVVIRPTGNSLVVCPPLTTGPEELAYIGRAIETGLNTTLDQLHQAGEI